MNKEPVSVSEAEEGKKTAVLGRIAGRVGMSNTGKRTVVTVSLRDERSSLQLTWYNMPFLRNTLRSGGLYIFRGIVVKKGGRLTMEQPEIFGREDYRRLCFIPCIRYTV